MTPDGHVFAVLSPSVLAKILEHRQCQPLDSEAGGVLLGCRRGLHFEVVHATKPFSTDARTRTTFSRDEFGHQQEAAAHWRRSAGRVGYIGEWHTHPEDVPLPSWLDRREWEKLGRNGGMALPHLAIIVGTSRLYVAHISGVGEICEMSLVID